MSAAPLQAAIEVLASRDVVPLISARCTALTEAHLKAVIDPTGDKGLFQRRRLLRYGEGTVRLALSHAKRPEGCRQGPRHPLRLQVVRVVKDKDGDLVVDTSLTPAKPVGDFLMPPAEVGTASACFLDRTRWAVCGMQAYLGQRCASHVWGGTGRVAMSRWFAPSVLVDMGCHVASLPLDTSCWKRVEC